MISAAVWASFLLPSLLVAQHQDVGSGNKSQVEVTMGFPDDVVALLPTRVLITLRNVSPEPIDVVMPTGGPLCHSPIYFLEPLSDGGRRLIRPIRRRVGATTHSPCTDKRRTQTLQRGQEVTFGLDLSVDFAGGLPVFERPGKVELIAIYDWEHGAVVRESVHEPLRGTRSPIVLLTVKQRLPDKCASMLRTRSDIPSVFYLPRRFRVQAHEREVYRATVENCRGSLFAPYVELAELMQRGSERRIGRAAALRSLEKLTKLPKNTFVFQNDARLLMEELKRHRSTEH